MVALQKDTLANGSRVSPEKAAEYERRWLKQASRFKKMGLVDEARFMLRRAWRWRAFAQAGGLQQEKA